MEKVNGKYYPLWSQFIDHQAEWIGNILEDHDMGMIASTKITGIALKPNGDDSAYFSVDGVAFGCGFDVAHGGIVSGEEGWVSFSGYGGHSWRIKSNKVAE